MKVAFANDHAAVEARRIILDELKNLGVEIVDCGIDREERVDYPDMAHAACKAVQDGRADVAVVVCGTGIGISIAANKHRGIRCALCTDLYAAEMARDHNNANVLALRGREFDLELNRQIVRKYIETAYSGGERHQQRIDKISQIEKDEGIIDPPSC